MLRKFNFQNKQITIYVDNKENQSNLPIIIYHSFSENTENLWNELLKLKCDNFVLATISNINWDDEMSPYYMEPLFKGDEERLGKADQYIEELTKGIIPKIKVILLEMNIYPKEFAIAGYSLSGLFALYSMYKTDIFSKFVSCSGSLWYKDFDKFVYGNKPIVKPKQIYLSLGDKEKLAKNRILSTVEEKTIKIYEFYKDQGINIKFELNEGNHFKDENKRVSKGIKSILY